MIRKILKRVNISKNKKNVAKISTGTMLGQLISLITLPVLTRIYGAEIFGIWALIHSLSLIINSFSDFGLSYSLMVEKDNKIPKGYKIISTISLFISLLSSLILTLFYVFMNEDIMVSYSIFFVLIFLTSFLSQQVQICYTWLNRKEEYDVLMKNPILNQSIYSVVGIMLGFLGFVQYGFFIAHILGSFVTLINMKSKLPKGLVTFDFKEIYLYIRENRKFALYQTPTNFSNNLKSQTPTLLINSLWGSEVLGYYSITIRILKIPVTLLGQAIGRVFFQVVTKMKRQGEEIGEYVLNNIFKAMKVSVLPIILLVAFGDIVTVLFLGEEWVVAGHFVMILAFQYFFMFLQSSVQGLAITIEKQKYAMIANLLQVIGIIVSLIVGKYLFDSIYLALILMVILFTIIHISYFCVLFKVMKVNRLSYVIKVVINSLIIILTSFILRNIFNYIFN
ncbi:oligosaccharide flippase family protein [Oceanobacillus manasiensis]|uniref:oligosaccharide flippase family protein n=1 Tax=Oceanobacillus manasiensis TaxID=586413 RepID=UPI0005A852B8|nr:oligosaccharide flippase family protein [Oceanobacillus manasiensis]